MVTRSRWLYTTTAWASNRAIYRENCSRSESRQPNEESPSSWRNLSSPHRSQGSPRVEDCRNGTDRATEQNGPGKRCHHATQMERTIFIIFLDAYRMLYLSNLSLDSALSWFISENTTRGAKQNIEKVGGGD